MKVEMKKDLMVKEDKTKAARAAELRDLAMQAMRVRIIWGSKQ